MTPGDWAWLDEIGQKAVLVCSLGLEDPRREPKLRMYQCIVDLRAALESVLQGKPGAKEQAAHVLAAWAAGHPPAEGQPAPGRKTEPEPLLPAKGYRGKGDTPPPPPPPAGTALHPIPRRRYAS